MGKNKKKSTYLCNSFYMDKLPFLANYAVIAENEMRKADL